MREAVIGFINRLRECGVRISIAESLDAANAVAAAGLQRGRMREALAASLIKDEADRPVFDREFDAFFSAGGKRQSQPRRGQSWKGMTGQHGRRSESPGQRPPIKPKAPPSSQSERRPAMQEQPGGKDAVGDQQREVE